MGYLRESFVLGSTQALVGLSAATAVIPPAFCVGGYIQQSLAAGTLWLGSGISQIPGTSGAMMWINTNNNPFEFQGPARFFLYATGASVVAQLGFKFAEGVSSPVAGG